MTMNNQCSDNCNHESHPHKGRKSVTLDLWKKNLLYDIKNMAFVEGETLSDTEVKKQVQDIGNDGNIDRVTRMLDLYHAECVELLYAYTKEWMHPIDWEDDTQKLPNLYHVIMWVPEDFSRTTVNMMVQCMHEYIVAKVLQDWLSVVNPQAATKWEAKAETVKEKLQECVNRRINRVRRRQSPF